MGRCNEACSGCWIAGNHQRPATTPATRYKQQQPAPTLSSATLGMCTYDWKWEDSCCTASSRCAASAYSCRSTASCSWSARQKGRGSSAE